MARPKTQNSIHSLLERILGFVDDKTRLRLRNYIDSGKKTSISIFEKYRRRPKKSDYQDHPDNKTREEPWQIDDSARTLVENILILNSLFDKPALVADIFNNKCEKPILKNELKKTETELVYKYAAYRFWFYNFSQIQNKILEGNID